MDYNAFYNSNGKIAADSDFFKNHADVFTASDGIIDGFKTVLGEQIIHVRQPWRTPFYAACIGAPLRFGSAWEERILDKTPTYEFNPKATAQDDLGFYDSSGYEQVFTINYGGRKSVSASSDLALQELITAGHSGNINDYLVDGMRKDVQGDLEAMTGVNLVSRIAKELTEQDLSTGEAMREIINDVALDMKESGVKYSDLGRSTEYADEVIVFMDAKKARALGNSEAVLPTPSKLNVEARIIPVIGGLPKPITTAQFNAGRGQDSTAYTGGAPAAVDKDVPDMIIMDAKYCEVRPFLQEWKMTSSYNGAGDFRNYHCLYKGAIGLKPWRSAVRVYGS